MALDFPATPTNGQVYGSYTYNSTVGAWQAREDSRTVAVLSSTVPASANPGDIWVNTNDGISFVYYNDGTSAQWIEMLPSGVPLLSTKADLANPVFTNNVTITNDLNINGSDINGDGKTIARFNDTWLRLNPDSEFTDGTYAGTTTLRTDGEFHVGNGGSTFKASSTLLTHNGTDIVKKDGLQSYVIGAGGTSTSLNYYDIFTWVITGQYNNFSTIIQVNGRGNTDPRYTVHIRGEYAVSTWGVASLVINSDHALPDGDSWIATFNNTTKTAKLYYRRASNDWNDRIAKPLSNHLSGSTFAYANSNFGTTAPTGDTVITKTAPEPVAVVSGGTGATTLASGGYLKGAGTGAITSQAGIPATDITSGLLDINRLPAGSVIQAQYYFNSTFNYYATTSFTDVSSSLRLNFTPKLAGSKMIIICAMNWLQEGGHRQAVRLLRGGVTVGNDMWFSTSITSGWTSSVMNHMWEDTAAHTANTQITYSFQTATSANNMYYNYNFDGQTGSSNYLILEVKV